MKDWVMKDWVMKDWVMQGRLPTLGLSFAWLLVGCGPEVATDYSEQTRQAFLASCTDPLDDTLLRIELCQCVFDESQQAIPYDRFAALDAELTLDPAAALPVELTELVADCVISIAEL
jgi:hypothetical protein